MLYNTSIQFPYLFSLLSGNTQLDTNFDSINRSIALILLTGKGEVFGNPEFGSDIKRYQFQEMTPAVQQLLADVIIDAITKNENRIDINNKDIQMEQVEDKLYIKLSYALRNSNLNGVANVIVPLPTPEEV